MAAAAAAGGSAAAPGRKGSGLRGGEGARLRGGRAAAASAAGEVRRLQGGRGAGSGEGMERGYVERNGKGKENEGGMGKGKKPIDRKLLELRSPVDSASRGDVRK